MIKNFGTGILVVLVVVVLVVLELQPLLAPLSPPSVGLSNLVHMKLNYILCQVEEDYQQDFPIAAESIRT